MTERLKQAGVYVTVFGLAVGAFFVGEISGERHVMRRTHVVPFDMRQSYGPYFGTCVYERPTAYCAVTRD